MIPSGSSLNAIMQSDETCVPRGFVTAETCIDVNGIRIIRSVSHTTQDEPSAATGRPLDIGCDGRSMRPHIFSQAL